MPGLLDSWLLDSWFASRAGQRLQFVLVDLDLARFLHLIAQVGHKQSEQLLLLPLDQRVSNLIALRGEVSVRWRLNLKHGNDDSIGAAVDGPADVARLHAECNRSLSGHRADIGNLSIGQYKVAGLHRYAQFCCRLLQIVRSLGAVGTSLHLLRQQAVRTLLL